MIKQKYEDIRDISRTKRSLYKKCKKYQEEIETGNENAQIEFEDLDIWYFTNRLFYYRRFLLSPKKKFILQTCKKYINEKSYYDMTCDEAYALKFMWNHGDKITKRREHEQKR